MGESLQISHQYANFSSSQSAQPTLSVLVLSKEKYRFSYCILSLHLINLERYKGKIIKIESLQAILFYFYLQRATQEFPNVTLELVSHSEKV